MREEAGFQPAGALNDLPFCCNFMCPVSPLNPDELLCQPCDLEDEGFEQVSDASILPHVDKDEKLADSDIMDIDDDATVQAAKPLPQPKVCLLYTSDAADE